MPTRSLNPNIQIQKMKILPLAYVLKCSHSEGSFIMKFEKLFTPYKIGKMEVKNRLVMSPMGTNSAFTNGRKDEQEIDYFIRRAKGGVGMIINGCQMLNEVIAQGSMEGYLDSYSVLPALTSMVDGVHRYGTRIVCQISPGTGRNAFPDTMGRPPMSASAIPSAFDPNVICHALTKEEIDEIMKGTEFAAGLARDAGYDAIEIHAHAGYLIDQFMSACWNKRDDEYGGSAENRTRFAREMVAAIRRAVGKDMPILFRMSLDHRFEGGRTLDESMALLEALDDGNIDAFDIDAGCYETLDYIFPPAYLGTACMDYVCKEARKHTDKVLLNAGTHDPESALGLIESGEADFAMLGRPLIADPDLPNKLMHDHREQVRPCLRCNEFCIGRIWNNHTKLSCAVNPEAMEEVRFHITKSEQPQNVIIIGGGPAGLEAARVAALEGHHVALYDANKRLGGTMRTIATAKFKEKIAQLADYYEEELTRLHVDVHLNTYVTGDEDFLKAADHIIVGTGTKPFTPSIPGIEDKRVIDIISAHKDESQIKGEHVVICGGGLSGCDAALELASEKGKDVTVVEMMDECAKDAMFINKITLFRKLAESHVTLLTNTKVTSIQEDGVHCQTNEGEKILRADTIISAFGMRPVTDIADKIDAKYHLKTRKVGDLFKLGKIGDAIREGYYAGSTIE